MKVYAGSVILEPTLNGNDLGEIAKKGVWLAKAGFGAFKTAFEYAPLIAAARAHGMITTCHTGGSSIPGSGAITGDHLLAMKPHVSFHVNGGPTAMPDRDFERIIVEGDMALQVCTAGNLRTALLCATLARRHEAFDRLIVAPTRRPEAASCRSACSTPCLISPASAGIAPELCIAAATGSNARVYGLDSGLLAAGKAADVVLLDAPDGGTRTMRSPRSRTATSRRSARSLSAAGHGSLAAAEIPPQRRRRSASQAAGSRRISRASPHWMAVAAPAGNRDCSIMQHERRKPPAMRSNCALQRCICALHA